MARGIDYKNLNGSNLKVGLVVAHYNGDYTGPLKKWCIKSLLDSSVKEKNIFCVEVAGAYEILFGINKMLKIHKVDVVIPLSCLIKGETMHFEYISEAVTQGIGRYNTDGKVPVIFGILNCFTEDQAKARTVENEKNVGWEFGKTAVEMGLLKKQN